MDDASLFQLNMPTLVRSTAESSTTPLLKPFSRGGTHSNSAPYLIRSHQWTGSAPVSRPETLKPHRSKAAIMRLTAGINAASRRDHDRRHRFFGKMEK